MEERGQETIKEQDWRRGKKKKMEEHNEGRTENMRKSNLQSVEDQSVSEMDSEAESKVWGNGEKKHSSYSGIFVLTFSDY